MGYDRDDLILKASIVTKEIKANCELIHTDFGYKVISRAPDDHKKHCCDVCGDTNPEHFLKGNKSTCKNCANKMSRNEFTMEERIYKRSNHSSRARNLDFDLDVTYIKELLEKQQNKCIYSGVEFGDNFQDKLTYPTLDRIDSSKGYIKGNVCLCT